MKHCLPRPQPRRRKWNKGRRFYWYGGLPPTTKRGGRRQVRRGNDGSDKPDEREAGALRQRHALNIWHNKRTYPE